jgi:hypothetical protein
MSVRHRLLTQYLSRRALQIWPIHQLLHGDYYSLCPSQIIRWYETKCKTAYMRGTLIWNALQTELLAMNKVFVPIR